MCSMTYLAQHVASCDIDLRRNSDIDLLRSICTYFDASRREEYDAAKISSLAFLLQNLFAKKKRFRKTPYFDISWPLYCTLACWSFANFDGMLAKDLWKSYRLLFFCGILPIMGSEIMAHSRKMSSRQIWPLVTSCDINIDLSGKWLECFRRYSLRAIERFSNAFLSLLVF